MSQTYQSLYRTYRPQNFDEVEGQRHVVSTLRSSVQQGKVAHAYLFAGPRGTGKTSSARIIAKVLNCEAPLSDGNPCNMCKNCLDAKDGTLIDIIEVDAASNRGIDEIRALRDNVNFAPTQGKKKVYIIDEVHMLSRDASNALLKTLEEPPSHVHFILATTEAHKILPTIISRCQYFKFYPLTTEEIIERLETILKAEGTTIAKDVLTVVATQAQGGMRDSITLLERVIASGLSTVAEVEQLFGLSSEESFAALHQAIITKDGTAMVTLFKKVTEEGIPDMEFLKGLLSYLHQRLRAHFLDKDAAFSLILPHIEALRRAINASHHAGYPLLTYEVEALRLVQTPEAPVSSPSPAPAVTTTAPARKPTAAKKKPASAVKATTPPPLAPSAPTPAVAKETSGSPLEMIAKKWRSLCFKFTDPKVRMAFSSGSKPRSLQDGVLTLALLQPEHKALLASKEHLDSLASIIQANLELDVTVTIDVPVDAPEPVPVAPEGASLPPTPEEIEEVSVETIAELFGGTIE